MSDSTRHRRVVEEIADGYRRDGFDVVVEPVSADLPRGLRRASPDLIAVRGDESVAATVVTRRSAEAAARAHATAVAVQEEPGWRHDFHLRPDPRAAPPKMMSRAEAHARVDAAETITDRDPSAGVLIAWTAAEWALRALLKDAAGDDIEHGLDVPPRRLVKEAYSWDVLPTEKQYATFNRLADLRDAIVHGARGDRVTARTAAAAVREARALVRRATEPSPPVPPGAGRGGTDGPFRGPAGR